MKYKHEYSYVITKSRSVGYTTSSALINNKDLKKCKYCDYVYLKGYSGIIKSIPNCISDEEKIIKDLLE